MGRTVVEYKTELRELAEFVPEVINFEDYLCSKFEEGLNLEVWEKMSMSGNQSYKEVVQLALREKKLANERLNRGKFQKRKNFGFLSGQSSKKRKSSKSSEYSSGSGTESVSSPQAFKDHNHLGYVHHRLVLLFEEDLCLKDVLVVISFIQKHVAYHKGFVFIVDNQYILRKIV